MTYTLYYGDCLDVMPTLPGGSIDAVIADPPYGTTACAWDSVIPLDAMWRELKRVIKPRGVIVLFASQPFTSRLITSNVDWFRYELIWDKESGTDSFKAKKRPLRSHENITIFSAGGNVYNPQMRIADKRNMRDRQKNHFKGYNGGVYGIQHPRVTDKNESERYPLSVYRCSNQGAELHRDKRLHPTQKPTELLRYLVRTYTHPGETVLDFTMGSGTTGVAALMEGRSFVGIELDRGYFDIAQRRIESVQPALLDAFSVENRRDDNSRPNGGVNARPDNSVG